MSGRAIALMLFLPLVMIAAVGLVLTEEVLQSKEATKAQADTRKDPLVGMRFNSASRTENFQRMGFDEKEQPRIQKELKILVDRFEVQTNPGGNRVRKMLEQVDDQDALEEAFCRSDRLPVRYAAMNFLLINKDAGLRPVDLAQITGLEAQGWFAEKRSVISSLHESADLRTDRREDSTRMVIGAILADKMDLLQKEEVPFSYSSLSWNGWSWDRLKEMSPGVDGIAIAYVALLQIVGEVAFSEGSICYDSDPANAEPKKP